MDLEEIISIGFTIFTVGACAYIIWANYDIKKNLRLYMKYKESQNKNRGYDK
jgi:hypothetical protein